MTNRSEAGVLVGVFSTLLAYGLWCAWQVRIGFPPEAPPDFLEIELHLRVYALAFVGISALGLGLALGIFRAKRWAYRALASLVSLTAVAAAMIRAVMPPRVVVDPDWPIVIALSLMAALFWHRAISNRTSPSRNNFDSGGS